MNRLRVFVAALVAISISLPLTAQDVKVSEWKHLFSGIDQATGSIDGPDYSQAYAVRVNLRAPGISFYTTPHQGSMNTVATTTSDFGKKFGLQVAVNANFFAPCCNAAAEEKTVLGLAVSDGNTVAVPNRIPGQNAALVITRDDQASIEETTEQMDLTNVFNAVTGSGIIVQNGVNVGDQTPYGDGSHPNPRTSVGLSQDGRFLYIVVIDGRQPGYSIGTKSVETAALMLAFGAYTAVNLDGGGSTDLVEDDGHGGAKIVNRPSGGAERFDAINWGFAPGRSRFSKTDKPSRQSLNTPHMGRIAKPALHTRSSLARSSSRPRLLASFVTKSTQRLRLGNLSSPMLRNLLR